MFIAILESILKRRDVGILMGFSILPMLTPFFMGNEDIDTMSNSDFTSNLLSFVSGALDTQYKLIIPTLIMGFIINSIFRSEIDSGRMFLYKDINKNRIFNVKIFGLIATYGLYFLLSFVLSVVTYFAFIVPKWHLSIHIIPSNIGEVQEVVLTMFTTVILNLITIMLVSMTSINGRAITSVLYGVLFTLLSMIAPMLPKLRYFLPNGYIKLLGNMHFNVVFAESLLVSFIYLFSFYTLSKIRFRKVEF